MEDPIPGDLSIVTQFPEGEPIVAMTVYAGQLFVATTRMVYVSVDGFFQPIRLTSHETKETK